jgi:secretion/DNA translocation related TadE-like protein
MVAAVLAVTVGFGYLGTAVVARHRAQSVADLAALAAAAHLVDGQAAACAQAVAVADAMSSRIADCSVDGLDVVITVEVGRARALARAGPAEVQA